MFTLPYGKTELTCRLPSASYEIIRYQGYNPDARDADVQACLDQPVASPPLEVLARGKHKAVILISDISRLCPSSVFLEHLLNRLNQGGITDHNITVIVALGMHRKQTPDELIQLAGESAYRRVQVLNHSALPEDCMLVGHTSKGTPVEINRHVVEADLRIATGNIEPHRLVGMSGGVKALVPGTASSRCIEAHHAMSQQYKIEPGRVDNPMHRDLEEAAAFVPLHFLFNVVVNHQRAILHAVCGNVSEAHRSGVERAQQLFSINVHKQYDVVIASPGGYPKDMQLYQTVKTLQNAEIITKPGGRIICAARCQEHYGNGELQTWIETIQEPDVILKRLQQKFVLGAHKAEHIYNITRKHQVFLHSEMPPSLVTLIGFTPVEDLQLLLDDVERQSGLDIAVMPYGALTFPAVR